MEKTLKIRCLLLAVVGFSLSFTSAAQNERPPLPPEYQQWLRDKFSDQHDKLIPIVAVADMYFACNQARKVDKEQLSVEALVTQLTREELATRLSNCLQGDLPNSDIALNFGLIGCFHEQLKSLSAEDRAIKQKLVRQAIARLSKAERQQSFTQCVTDQAIGYLK